MGKKEYKVLYNGGRARSHLPIPLVKVEPPEFNSIYQIILMCKPGQFSEGLAKKQIQTLAAQRMPLKECDFVFQLIKLPNKFYYAGDFWSRPQREQKQFTINQAKAKQDASYCLTKSSDWSDADVGKELLSIIRPYPELMEEFRPHLAMLLPQEFQFLEGKHHDKHSLMFWVQEEKLLDVKLYATKYRFSFKAFDVPYWDRSQNLGYWGSSTKIMRKVVVFGADEAKRLVGIKFKIPLWQDK